MESKPYDMNNPEDRARWYREMKGYLTLAGEDNFLIQGTDRKGRQYAWEAFRSIENEFQYAPAISALEELDLRIAKKINDIVEGEPIGDLHAISKDCHVAAYTVVREWIRQSLGVKKP